MSDSWKQWMSSPSFSPLLAWAIATGRMNEAQRGQWVNRLVEGRADSVVETLLCAAPDPAKGDFPPPFPWGMGDASTCETLVKAKAAARRGRSAVHASKGRTHFAASPDHLRAPSVAASSTSTDAPTTTLGGIDMSGTPGPTGTPPKLFVSGDLPAICASGIDVKLLGKVPWQARPALARAQTLPAAHALLEQYGGSDGETQAEIDSMPGRALAADVTEYNQRLSRWASGFDT